MSCFVRYLYINGENVKGRGMAIGGCELSRREGWKVSFAGGWVTVSGEGPSDTVGERQIAGRSNPAQGLSPAGGGLSPAVSKSPYPFASSMVTFEFGTAGKINHLLNKLQLLYKLTLGKQNASCLRKDSPKQGF
jgi:hypothetical protein